MVMFESAVAFVSTLVYISEDIKLSLTFSNIASLFFNDTDIKEHLGSV